MHSNLIFGRPRAAILCVWLVLGLVFAATSLQAQRQMDRLGRGLTVFRKTSTQFYAGWRLLASDPEDVGFNLYRSTGGGAFAKLNSAPLTNTTDYLDATAPPAQSNAWQVVPVINGVEQAPGLPWGLPANAALRTYLAIPLRPNPGGLPPAAGRVSLGDLDANGELDFVAQWSGDAANHQPGGGSPSLDTFKVDGYRPDGTFLWRINLGWNIESGEDFSPSLVFDFDGDGVAEFVTKTAEGTTDGTGATIGDTNGDGKTDYRDAVGAVNTGPEFLSVFSGRTGRELARTNWIARGNLTDWGDGYGNRANRENIAVAYLDGVHPSIIVMRGYYALTKMEAWNYRNGQLVRVWSWSSNGNSLYEGQGFHHPKTGDVDGDGKDEILRGALTIDHNGTVMYSTALGHGDRFHLTDIDPARPGLEVWAIHEGANIYRGADCYDPQNGNAVWGKGTSGDGGSCLTAPLVPGLRGNENWTGGLVQNAVFDCKGNLFNAGIGDVHWMIWWGSNLCRQVISPHSDGIHVVNEDIISGHGGDLGKSINVNEVFGGVGDAFGDWREELFTFWPNSTGISELRVYETPAPATNRIYCLMNDPVYRINLANQAQRPLPTSSTGFYLGPGMARPPLAPVSDTRWVWRGGGGGNTWDLAATANWASNGIWSSSPALTTFQTGKPVLFDLTGSNNLPITLVGALTPGGVVANIPAAASCVFGGSGSLAGTNGLGKIGRGSLTLNTTNSYTGTTLVNEGALLVNGSLDQSPIVVRGGLWLDGRVGGNGRLGRGVSIEFGGGLSPGNGSNSAGGLVISNSLALLGETINNFDLSDDPGGLTKTNDRVNVFGNLTLAGTNNQLVINRLNGTLAPGTYTLISYSAALAGGLSNLTVSGIAGVPAVLTNPPGAIALVVRNTRSAGNLTWTGGVGNTWDVVTSSNWLNGASRDWFVPLDRVRFDGTGVSNPVVNVSAVVTPGSVEVNSSGAYTLTGSGSISGATGLTKTNVGTLTVLNANSYTGPTVVGGGTLEFAALANAGSPSSIGAANANPSNLVFYGSTLRLVGPSTSTDRGATLKSGMTTFDLPAANGMLTFGTLAGTGGLTKSGAGQLVLTSSNSYSGGTIIDAGTIYLGSASANRYGLGTGSLTLNGGALVMDPNATYDNAYWNLIVPSNSVVTWEANGKCSFYGTLIGSGTINWSANFFRAAFCGNYSAFTGAINVGGTEFRVNNRYGFGGTAFHLDSTSLMGCLLSGTTVDVGALSGEVGAQLGTCSLGKGATWRVGGKNTSATFNGSIVDSSSSTRIIKVGTNVWTLTGASTYTGGTLISNGVLLVGNTLGSGTGSGAVSVYSGGSLGGSGSVDGLVTINAGGGLSPAGSFAINNNLALNPNALLNFHCGATNDLVLVGGRLTLAGKLNVLDAGGMQTGTNTLMRYGAGLDGVGLMIQSQPPGFNCRVNTNTPGQVDLISTYVPPVPAAPMGLVAIPGNGMVLLKWNPSSFAESYTLKRATTNTGPFAVVLSGIKETNVIDASVVASVTYYYVVAGTNISGQGPDSTVASATPYFTPPAYWTNLATGTVQAWNVGSNWTNSAGFPNATGAVAMIKADIAASQTIALGTNILLGRLSLGDASGGASYVVTNGGGALIFDDGEFPTAMTQLPSSKGDTIAASLVLNSDLAISNASPNPLVLSGPISGAGGLSFNGTNQLTLATNNSFTGGMFLNGGTLSLASSNANLFALGTNLVTFNGGTFKPYGWTSQDGKSSWNSSNSYHVPIGQTGTIWNMQRGAQYGRLTGAGTLNLYVSYVRGGLAGDWSAFGGRLNVRSSRGGANIDDFRISNSYGYPNASVDLGSNINAYPTTAGTSVAFGALSGSSSALLGGADWVIGSRDTDASFAGTITSNSVVKVGTGTWTVTGANKYSGGTTVSSGRLLVNNGAGSGTGPGAVTVSGPAVLGGNGAIGGPVSLTSGASLSPGSDGIGVLTVSNSLTLAAGSHTLMEVDASARTNDQLRVSGQVTLDGTLIVINAGSADLAAGDNFKLFSCTPPAGAFVTMNLPPLGSNLLWNTSRLLPEGTIWVVSTAAPVLGHVRFTGTDVVMNGSGGTPGWPCYLVTSTNLLLPTGQWVPVATNLFDALGSALLTNRPAPGTAQQFFQLQVPWNP